MTVSSNGVFSFPLALSRTNQYVYCSLHTICNPSSLSRKLKTDARLAIMDASRIVSPRQLVCAANRASCLPQPTVWDVVYLAAASTNVGSVLRDYAYLGDDDSTEEETTVLVLHISSEKMQAYQALLKEWNLFDSVQHNMMEYFEKQQDSNRDKFQSLYKLTKQELQVSSLESCILTKIATKML